MYTPGKLRSYKFNFWKDKFWMWALALPFGLICWAIPFVLFVGLLNTDNSPGWFPFFAFVFLGVPGYLVGWIFVYSLMEGIYTRVTFAENRVSLRLPWIVFPLIPVVKKIDLERIRRVNLFTPYGSRTAIFLYFFENNKERHFYLPKFKNNPLYLDEIMAIQKRVEAPHSTEGGAMPPASGPWKAKEELLQSRVSRFDGRPTFIQRVIRLLYFFVLFGIYGISAWITHDVPPGGTDAVEIGLGMGFIFSLFGFVGVLPFIGQILIWFFGRCGIGVIAEWLFHLSPDAVYWDIPESLRGIFSSFHIPPIHATFSDFLFWSILVFSVLVSLDNGIAWFRQQALKRHTGVPIG
ncbi:MAG: hypothetical protein GYA59_02660 [Chloroflexi bacterium]|nr:hypothetical protein [Chloroflexota bacterium]